LGEDVTVLWRGGPQEERYVDGKVRVRRVRPARVGLVRGARLYWRYARDLVTALEWSAGVGRAVRDLAAANRVDVIVAPEVQASAFHVSRDKPAPLLVTCHAPHRSEEHTSELQSHLNLVCRL